MLNVTQKPHLHQDWIDPHAIGIVKALQKAGFTSYLVGGCVRDLLIGIHPKDFDIATDARPDEVKRIIHRAYVIGKRFRLVLVRREEQQFEVATFRREVPKEEPKEDAGGDEVSEDSAPAPFGDNVFGTAEEDAKRRDFTINGLFYDPIGDQLIDFAEGLPDLEAKWVRMIGDPRVRLAEDPIRILRALRLKHMIHFSLDPELREGMREFAHTLTTTALPRRREEILKLVRLKNPDLAFREAHDLGIMQYLSPTLAKHMEGENCDLFFENLRQHKTSMGDNGTPGELFAAVVHSFVRAFMEPDPNHGSRSVFENTEFQTWMRDELGMFKHEQALTVKALHVEPLLARRKEFQRKGERRQRALLSNDAFPLAYRFACQDFLLSCEDSLYWSEAYEQLRLANPNGIPSSGGGGMGGGGDRKRRRRTRRPRRGPKRNADEARS